MGEVKTAGIQDLSEDHISHQESGEWFERAFEAHWSTILRFLVRLTGDHQEAQDVALEVFWRLYQKPPRMTQNLNGWLYRVAANLGYNALRSRRRRQHYEAQAGSIAREDRDYEDPARRMEKRQEQDLVGGILSGMNPRSAKILVMRHSGFSYKEIAEALEISPASVGTLLSRAEKDFSQRIRKLENRSDR